MQALYDPAKRVRFLLTETAPYYRICPASVHRGQLDQLLATSDMDTISLAIIPVHGYLARGVLARLHHVR